MNANDAAFPQHAGEDGGDQRVNEPTITIMNCTCSKRLLPCPVHPDRHLPFAPEPCVKMFVINLHEAWPVESVDRKDIRYYASVVEDAIRVFKSSDHTSLNSAVLEAVNFLTLTTR